MSKDKHIEQLLQMALQANENPEQSLNEKIVTQQKERKEMKKGRKKWAIAAAIAAVVVIPSTVIGATYLKNASQITKEIIEDKTLAEHLEKENVNSYEKQVYGQYEITLYGVISGQEISDFSGSSWEVFPDRTYAVVSIAKVNKEPIDYSEDTKTFLATPFIQGLDIKDYNIFTMHGSHTEKIEDGVLYRVIECDSLEYFADREVYLGVTDNGSDFHSVFQYDKKTGVVTREESYKGVNALFKLPLDKKKANKKKAKQYLKDLQQEQELERQSNNNNTKEIEFPTPEEVMERATLIKDSVKKLTKDKEGLCKYEYNEAVGYTDLNYTSVGYTLGPISEDDTTRTYTIFYRDENDNVTGMMYEELIDNKTK